MSELVKTTQSMPSEIDYEKVRRLVTKGSASPLSNERETGPFLMFLAGDTLDEIAYKQQIPRDVLEVTAVHYDWEKKRQLFGSTGLSLESVLQKKIAMTLMITAYTQVMKDMADVAAGRKEAKDCLFIPKNTSGLGQLIEFMKLANELALPPDPNKPAQVAPTVNVNVNTAPGAEPPTVTVSKIDPEEKARMLRELAGKK
jgi:hypothetical protein